MLLVKLKLLSLAAKSDVVHVSHVMQYAAQQLSLRCNDSVTLLSGLSADKGTLSEYSLDHAHCHCACHEGQGSSASVAASEFCSLSQTCILMLDSIVQYRAYHTSYTVFGSCFSRPTMLPGISAAPGICLEVMQNTTCVPTALEHFSQGLVQQ